ncbi:ATP-grasp domain-containing protein [Lederbergia panacisoli]|uniref:ATP-grasp domain-containing protein n=1 Tax=Lederbergia panacisoli TaxID=1255251 RepID=UPI00214C45B2|nr:ATP-grasp domain-containing protein [Lederbergia panacisoli]MCR2821966.1 ATP-grasp domain-containing protein [Lederbergia panacisoli]
METIIFIGCYKTGTSAEALFIAKELGYFIVLFTNKKTISFSPIDHQIYSNNIFDEDFILNEIDTLIEQGYQIRACLSFIDPFVSYAASLSNKLGLTNLSVDSLSLMENKLFVRNRLKDHPGTPFYTAIDEACSLEKLLKNGNLPLPFILKNPISTGAKDVMFVESLETFNNAIHYLQKFKNPMLLEEYIPGPQYLIEIIVLNSKIFVIAVIEQEVVYEGIFLVEGYHYPAQLENKEYESLIESIKGIVERLELTNGSCHVEMRNTQVGWKLIEINPRMSGGNMNRIIEEGTGINLIKEIIKMYAGEQPAIIPKKAKYVYARYLTVKSTGILVKIHGKDEALKHTGVKLVDIKADEGDLLSIPYSMGNRYGSVIAVGNSKEEAKANANRAVKEIRFYIEPLEKMGL